MSRPSDMRKAQVLRCLSLDGTGMAGCWGSGTSSGSGEAIRSYGPSVYGDILWDIL